MARDTKKTAAHNKNTLRADIYQEVTDQIVALLEQGVRPWSPSWSGAAISSPLRHCGTAYRGINILLLWAESIRRGFGSPYWMTFKQAVELGGAVRIGEKGTAIVFAGSITAKSDESDEIVPEGVGEGERRLPFLKRYHVFNIAQIDGLPSGRFTAPESETRNPDEHHIAFDAFFTSYGVEIREHEGGAFYSCRTDSIAMPRFETFVSANAFYSTLAHEAVHSSGHRDRLNRETLRDYHTSTAMRAKEELVAEIGAAFVCAALGMEPTEREDHAAYLASWLAVLKNDKRAIFRAASAAQAASAFMLAALVTDEKRVS